VYWWDGSDPKMVPHPPEERSACRAAPSDPNKLRGNFLQPSSPRVIFILRRAAVRYLRRRRPQSRCVSSDAFHVAENSKTFCNAWRKSEGCGRKTRSLAFSSPASCTMISATSIWSTKPCNPSTTRSARGCHPCLRYVVLPMCPGRTKKIWSGRRDSNPRPRPWQGRALPLSYTRIREIGGERSPTTGRAMPNAALECNSWCETQNRPDGSYNGCPRPNQPESGQSGVPPIANWAFKRQLGLEKC
jgi:hypothetical protein